MMMIWKDAAFRGPFYGAVFAILGVIVKRIYEGTPATPKEADPELRQHLDKMISQYIGGGAAALCAWLMTNAEEITTEQDAAAAVSNFETHYPRVVAKREWVLQLEGQAHAEVV